MIVTTHQPLFLPWPGFFCKAMSADVMVLLDDVQFPRGGSWVTRNRLKSHQGEIWLRVPVRKRGLGLQTIGNVQLYGETGWRAKHLRSIREQYANAPYLGEFFSRLESIYQQSGDRLLELNLALIQTLWDGIDGPEKSKIVLQSETGIAGKGTELLINLCNYFGATSYVTLAPVEKYLEKEKFATRGVELRFLHFSPPVYPQLWGEFRSNLSALDLLLNCGPKSTEILSRAYRVESK